MATTTRWGLPYPVGTDAPDGPAELAALAVALDDHAKDDQGTLANRPVSTAMVPGKKGRYYMVFGDGTSGNNGILWRDNGTGWDKVGGNPQTLVDLRANRPAANAVPVNTRFVATDQLAEWVSDGAVWTRIGAQAGETTITLAAAASAGKILLQGQAWPSTTGIYADLHTLFGGTTLPDMRQRVPVGYKAADSDFGTLLATGGEKTHVLTDAELPADVARNVAGAVGSPWQPGLTNIEVGGGGAHNNLQPFIVVNFEAKL